MIELICIGKVVLEHKRDLDTEPENNIITCESDPDDVGIVEHKLRQKEYYAQKKLLEDSQLGSLRQHSHLG